jgi:transitional endoplasmic reticulum ATPase
VGESEKALRQVFLKARQASPCILFFDELDTIFPRRGQAQDFGGRERLVGQFLAEMGSLEPFSEVVVIGATNRLDLVEPALLNPGRFSFVIDLKPPDSTEREAILNIHARHIPLHPDVSLAKIADRSDGFTGADLATLCQRASFERLQGFIALHGPEAEAHAPQFNVRSEDFLRALESLRAIHQDAASSNGQAVEPASPESTPAIPRTASR